MHHADEPGGGAVRAGEPGSPLQADIPAQQGADDRPVGLVLSPGRLPSPAKAACAGLVEPRRAPRPGLRRRSHRDLHARLMGRPCGEHFPCHEEGTYVVTSSLIEERFKNFNELHRKSSRLIM